MSLKNGQSANFYATIAYPKRRQGKTCQLTLSPDKFPASVAFDTINAALDSEAERKDAIKQGNALFAFTLKNAAGETADWHIDLKNEGKAGSGLGNKPTGKPLHATVPPRCFCLLADWWLTIIK